MILLVQVRDMFIVWFSPCLLHGNPNAAVAGCEQQTRRGEARARCARA